MVKIAITTANGTSYFETGLQGDGVISRLSISSGTTNINTKKNGVENEENVPFIVFDTTNPHKIAFGKDYFVLEHLNELKIVFGAIGNLKVISLENLLKAYSKIQDRRIRSNFIKSVRSEFLKINKVIYSLYKELNSNNDSKPVFFSDEINSMISETLRRYNKKRRP